MRSRDGKTGVYVALLVAIVVIIAVVMARGGSEEAEQDVNPDIPTRQSVNEYHNWVENTLEPAIEGMPDDVPKNDVSMLTTIDPSTGARIVMDPFQGTPIEGTGTVVSATEAEKGNWRVTVDMSQPPDGEADVTMTVARRYVEGTAPAVGSEVSFAGFLTRWHYVPGEPAELTLEDTKLLR